MEELVIRYIHFVGIMGGTATLISEHLLLPAKVSLKQFKRVVVIDAFYGIFAVVVLVTGLLLWLSVGKPADFYTKNWLFHTKLVLFVVITLLSIYPTVFFLKNRNSAEEIIEVPKLVIMLIRAEILLLFAIPLLAVFMARGYGFITPS